MALIDGLYAIGDAIREKTGGTDLIPFLDMPEAIRSISGGGTPQPESVPNPLEYVIDMSNAFKGVTFPTGYELSIDIPFVTILNGLCWNTTGLKKLTLKGNTSGQVVSFSMLCLNSVNLEIVDLTEYTAKVSNFNNAFGNAKLLKEILGELDFSECTTASAPFSVCTSLEKVSFKANTISLSISFAQSTKLSATSIQSIIDGLATVETAQTVTLPKNLSAEAEAVVSANTEEIDGEIRIKGKEGWTLVR
jgi:hypothetical protein